MGRIDVDILLDDEEADIAGFMLNACGIESREFYSDERIFTKENFEKNYKVLKKMVQTRAKTSRAPYFVIGYLALLTGAKMSKNLQKKIILNTNWDHEEGYWQDKGFALKRRIYLEDFQQKIKIHKAGIRLHAASFKYSEEDFTENKIIVSMNQYQNYYDRGKLQQVNHINLDGWNLKSIPKEIFELKNLKTLSLEFNALTKIPDKVSTLVSLKHLFLDYNLLKVLPESIGNLESLKSLNIINNNGSYLPESIKNLKNLKHICIRGNKINQTPEFLRNSRYDDYNKTIYIE